MRHCPSSQRSSVRFVGSRAPFYHICWAPGGSWFMNLPKLPVLISAAIVALLVAAGAANAVILNCPPAIIVKAAGAPYPWTDSSNQDAVLHFAEASYSCSN